MDEPIYYVWITHTNKSTPTCIYTIIVQIDDILAFGEEHTFAAFVVKYL